MRQEMREKVKNGPRMEIMPSCTVTEERAGQGVS